MTTHMTLSEATGPLESNPAVLSRALQDTRDSYESLRKNNPSPAPLDAEDARFWASLGDHVADAPPQRNDATLPHGGEAPRLRFHRVREEVSGKRDSDR